MRALQRERGPGAATPEPASTSKDLMTAGSDSTIPQLDEPRIIRAAVNLLLKGAARCL